MGLLDWIRGARSAASGSASGATKGKLVEVEEFGLGFLGIPRLGFSGQYSRSPNGRFTLVWRDGSASRGGVRDSGEGRYVLLDGKHAVVDGAMERPNDGKVADNGNFIFNDWLFSSDLKGEFRAFRSDGSPILVRRFSANLHNNGLSADGSLACCQSCNADNEDGGHLTIFSLTSGKSISSFIPESGWATSYEFPAALASVGLQYANSRSRFHYSLDGSFVDRKKWIAWRLKAGDLYMVEQCMAEAGGKPPQDLAKRLIASVDKGIQASEADARHQAWGWRIRGEILQAIGAEVDALQSYEQALSLDPGVGVKRRVDQMKKSRRR
jgi:hypothetical protein